MPRVLLVAYHWLPGLHHGARKLAALARHLPAAGWEPHVLTRDWGSEPGEPDVAQLDPDEASQPAALRAALQLPVVRSPMEDEASALRRWHGALRHDAADGGARGILRSIGRRSLDQTYPLYGAYPDAQRDWVTPAVEAGMTAVRKFGISAVVSAGPPTSAHIAGGEIAREAAIPWVVLADDLAGLFVDRADGRTKAQRLQARALARRWLRGSSRAGAATPAALEYLQEQFGLIGDVVVAPFDPDDRRVAPRRAPGAPLRLLHAGPVSADSHGFGLLLDGLDMLLAEDPSRAERLVVELLGATSDAALASRIGARPAASLITFRGAVSITEEARMLREADAVLQLEEEDPGAPGHSPQRHAPRLFRQLHARRPVVAIVRHPDSFVARVLADTRCGDAVDSPVALAGVFRGMLEQLSALGEVPFNGDESATAAYSAPEQARRLALLLDAAAGQRFGRWQRA